MLKTKDGCKNKFWYAKWSYPTAKEERHTIVYPFCQVVFANQPKRLVKIIGSVSIGSALMPCQNTLGYFVVFFNVKKRKHQSTGRSFHIKVSKVCTNYVYSLPT